MKVVKKMRAVKISEALIAKIEKKAKQQNRTPHYIMCQVLEKAFK